MTAITTCITVTETDYECSLQFTKLREAFEVRLVVVEEKCYDDGEYVFEVEVTGSAATQFVDMYYALFGG